jgi:hypothetical protein
VTVNLSGTVVLDTDAGNVSFSYTMPVFLPQGGTGEGGASVSFSNSRQALGSPDVTSLYVGTGTFPPFPTLSISGTLDVPTSIATVTPESVFAGLDGTETITYFAGSTFIASTPPSAMMMGTALMGVLVLTRRLLA